MRKLIALLLLALSAFGCTTSAPQTVYSIATATQIYATAIQVFTATSTPTVISTAIVTPKQIDTITFTTTGGVELTMPKFTGDNAVEDALQYISNHAKYVTGDARTTNWATLQNKKNVKAGRIHMAIPSYHAVGGPFAETLSGDPYILIIVYKIGNGTVIIYQDTNSDIKDVYIDGVDSVTLYHELQRGEVHIPKPQPATP